MEGSGARAKNVQVRLFVVCAKSYRCRCMQNCRWDDNRTFCTGYALEYDTMLRGVQPMMIFTILAVSFTTPVIIYSTILTSSVFAWGSSLFRRLAARILSSSSRRKYPLARRNAIFDFIVVDKLYVLSWKKNPEELPAELLTIINHEVLEESTSHSSRVTRRKWTENLFNTPPTPTPRVLPHDIDR